MRRALALALFLAAPVPALGQMTATLKAPWDGQRVPAGQQCRLFGGSRATPPMEVAGIPAGTASIVVAFNDRDFAPLSARGGHGTIGLPARGAKMTLPAVPGMTAQLPGGAVVVAPARATGEIASPGYLPPCSGGRGHRCFADVTAMDRASKPLATARVELGRY
jgi:phosphatidylethanolamine-binding protein (PEBP) family uncharacterized protein